jgi:hypothetical protein
VQLHVQGKAGNAVSETDATRIIEGGVQFMHLCGIAAGIKGKVKIGDVVVPRAVVDTTVKVIEGGERLPRPEITTPLKGVLLMNAAGRIDSDDWQSSSVSCFRRQSNRQLGTGNGTSPESPRRRRSMK